MPSSMLEQAVIDAEALREAAIKNAEQEVIEKYSGEIKEAVTSLLEQEEDPFAAEDEMGLGDEGDVEDRESVVDQIDMAATEGENTCPCPEEGEPLVLDLDQIVAAAEEAEATEEEELEIGEEPPAEEEELFEVNDQNLMQAIAEALNEKEEDEKQTPEERAKDIKGKGESVKSELADTPDDEKDDVLKALRKMSEGTKGYRKGDPSRGTPTEEDEDDPIDYEKKTKSGKREKIGGKVFEDSGEEEERHYKANREEDERHLDNLRKDVEDDERMAKEADTEEERRHYRANADEGRRHLHNLEKDAEDDERHEPLEESNLSDKQINDILEALVVDVENVPSGMMFHTHPTKGESERGLNVALAHEQDTAFAEEQKELRQAIKKLEEQIKSQKLQLNKQKKDYKNLKSIALKAGKKLEEVNFSNAKLIYTNRILKSDSLNERQKEKLAEALSKVGSVEEAKIVFDTLKDHFSSKGAKVPKTLNEAVSKNNPLILKSNTEKQPASQNQVERLRKLAGII